MKRSLALALPMAAILAASALAQDPHTGHDRGSHDPLAASTAAKSEATKAFEDANKKMHDQMNAALTGDPDVDFMRGMIPHHQGAIEMAEIVLKYGKDPETRKLADEIVKAQTAEIAFMKDWLAKRRK
ncbi:CopM family metallochaperone [Hyphomicrobium sp.]|uniref:CopM family metallochaperone n=1 Tax=Hyphomicrobium sp. TaxID=82 RepID=UPI002E315D51|nr:DUF305 domain-containing protein [Hyphomicrobium sp.]HEX2841554.1 DUF305 domain-containing protein [Hyphomicrobium sp.]